MSEVESKIVEADGQLVLVDPVVHAVLKVGARHNCRMVFEASAERVRHFVNRAAELGRSAQDVVIVIIDVDDVAGGLLAEALMPGHNWQAFRDAGMTPIARGLAGRDGIQVAVATLDAEMGAKLKSMTELAVVVVAHGVAAVFPAGDA